MANLRSYQARFGGPVAWILMLLLLAAPRSAEAQTRTIKGKVTSASSNEPMAGVSVTAKGKNAGTITATDGSFTLTLDGAVKTLVVSYVGFATQEVNIGGSDVLTVSLKASASGDLGEAVVIGYGSVKRQDVTSAVATVKPEDFNENGARNVLDLIQGKVAGLVVTRTSGTDPNSSPSIQIRSATSLTGTNSPLIVVDGIPGGNLDLLQQDDIASFDVLKDGSAAAIYGTQANGGVIIVTTKRGRPGTPHYDYSTYVSKQYLKYKPDFLTPSEYRQRISEGLISPTLGTGIYNGNTNAFDSVENKSNLTNYHNLSMSGGGANNSYRASIYYSTLEGLGKEDSRQQYGARFSTTQKGLQGRLEAQVDLATNYNKANLMGGGQWFNALTRIPTLPIHDSTGKFLTLPLIDNPVSDLAQETHTRDQSTNSGDARLSLEIWKGLKASVFGSIIRDSYTDNIYDDLNSDASLYQSYYPGGGFAEQYSQIATSYAFTPTLEYARTFAAKHNFSAVAGYNYQYEMLTDFEADNRAFINDVNTSNNLGSGNGLSTPGGADESSFKDDDKLIAFFGRVNYNYLDKYMLQVSFRREGSSKFGVNHKWGDFPAISAGWDLSREAFLQNSKIFNQLKLRAGYGVTGNSGIPDYQSLVTLTTGGQYAFPDGTYQQTYGAGNNPNPNLKWERKAETNIGVDFSLLDNRLTGSFDAFYRKTTDLLYNYNAQLPPYVQSSIYTNVGSMSSKGLELTVSGTVIKNKDFSWKSTVTASTTRNKMISLSNGIYQLSYFGLGGIPGYGALGNALRITQGGAIGNFYGKRFAGFDSSGHWLFATPKGGTVGLSNTNDSDQSVIGNAIPKLYVSWQNSFRYKNFDLTIFIRGRFIYKILNAVDLSYGNITAAGSANVLNNTFSKYARLKDTYAYSNYYLQPGGFLKLDNVSLGYTFKLRTELIRSLRIYATVNNIAEVTRYKGNDPDFIEDTGLTTGIDGSVTPSTRTALIGLNLGF
jgi:TonB-dependent starch-binding outer membrane protein SusC